MMIIVNDAIWLCDDCTIVAVNGDVSGIAFSYGNDADARIKAITDGLTRLGMGLSPNFDSESGDGIEEFSWRQCECCESRLGGGRHRFALLAAPFAVGDRVQIHPRFDRWMMGDRFGEVRRVRADAMRYYVQLDKSSKHYWYEFADLTAVHKGK